MSRANMKDEIECNQAHSPMAAEQASASTDLGKATDPTAIEEAAPEEQAYSAFSLPQRRCIVFLCALAGFFSPFSAFTYFPAIDAIAHDLNTTTALINISITVFLIAQGITPALFGGLADQIGRRPVYLVLLSVYLSACIGLALQNNYAALLVLRMLQSTGSSATIALGVVVVADIGAPHERGSYMGAMLTGIGPIVGGVLSEKANWRWIFWMLTILAGACLIPFIILFPETCRAVVGSGNITPKSSILNQPLIQWLVPLEAKTESLTPPEKSGSKSKAIPNPLECLKLLWSKEDALIMASNALYYMNYSVLHAALATLLIERYGLNSLQAGLCYLPYGVATVSSSYAIGWLMDKDYQAMAKARNLPQNRRAGDNINTIPIEEARVRSVWIAVLLAIAATLVFGWSLDRKLHISVPLIMSGICGVANTGVFNNCITLMVDVHPDKPGLASVAVSLTRCIAAAVSVAVLQPLFDTIGIGWTFTLFALLCLAAVPMLYLVRTRGPRWRGVLL